MPDWLTIAQARQAGGLRLVVTGGWGNPWVESAKAIFKVKGIQLTVADQYSDIEGLKTWTGQSSAPVAILDDEAPRSGWAEILLLAERMAPTPRLIPGRESDRIAMFGIGFELAGEDGFGWNRRLIMFRDSDHNLAPDDHVGRQSIRALKARYHYTDQAADRAADRCAAILSGLSALMREQHARGSAYLVGDGLSAADIYWAAFSLMLDPLPHELCPLPPSARVAWQVHDPRIWDCVDPLLLRHRDFILRNHIGLPLHF